MATSTTFSKPINDELSTIKIAITELDTDKYEKPSGGIPSSDMASAVQTSLGKADSSYQKPNAGIPASDLAKSYLETPVVAGTSGQALISNGSGGQAWGDILEHQSTVAIDDGVIELTEGSGGGGGGSCVIGFIDELTTSEAKTNIKLEFDKLTDFVALMEIPAGANSGHVAIKLNGTQYRTMGNAISGSKVRYIGVRYMQSYPFVEYLGGIDTGNTASWVTLCSAAGTYSNYTTWKSGFTSIEFVASSENVPFPTGTVVKLYGIEEESA